MDVVVLGSGTAVPVRDRFPAGYLVRHGSSVVCVDLGPGTLRRFAQAGHELDAISAVLLTHFHTDHCADLAALLFALRNPRYSKRERLSLRAAPGLADLLSGLSTTWPWCTASGYELDAVEIGPGTVPVDGLDELSITAFSIEHTDASLGYRFEGPDGATAAFSGDAVFCDGVIEMARDVDFFVCDAAFPSACPTPGHMTATEAGRAAQLAGAKVLCLTHFYPECDGHDVAAEAQAEFEGRVVLAADLHTFDLTTGRYAHVSD